MEVETSWGHTQTFESVLDEMVSARYECTELGPWCFEARVPGYESWWDVPVAGVLDMSSVRKVHGEYEKVIRKERIVLGRNND